jgi:hypothetical protein
MHRPRPWQIFLLLIANFTCCVASLAQVIADPIEPTRVTVIDGILSVLIEWRPSIRLVGYRETVKDGNLDFEFVACAMSTGY